MALSNQVLSNIHKMLDRVTMTGPEAIGWVEAKSALEAEMYERATNVPRPPTPPAPLAPPAP